jgi:hypothetical protein
VTCIGEDEKDVLNQAEEVLLEEHISDGRIGGGKIIHDLQTHWVLSTIKSADFT